MLSPYFYFSLLSIISHGTCMGLTPKDNLAWRNMAHLLSPIWKIVRWEALSIHWRCDTAHLGPNMYKYVSLCRLLTPSSPVPPSEAALVLGKWSDMSNHLGIHSSSELFIGFTNKLMLAGLYIPILPSCWTVRALLILVSLAHVCSVV